MKPAAPDAPEVLRGVRFEGAPLRLGRARAGAAALPAAQALVEEPSPEEELRQARALALRQAHEEGLRAGHAEGLREGRTQAAEEVRLAVEQALAQAEVRARSECERLRRIGQHAQAAVADVLWAAQDEIVALCYETLCRMVAASAVQPQVVRAQVAQLLAQHGAPAVVLHVHPQDAELLHGGSGADTALPVMADSEVALGGCIVKTGSGALDARLEVMLDACKSALLEVRARTAQPSTADEASP